MNIISLFSCCDSFKLRFERDGFDIHFANEFDPTIFETFKIYQHQTHLIEGNVRNVVLSKDNIN